WGLPAGRRHGAPAHAWSASARALASRRPPAPHHLARFLTRREREVLSRLVAGETTASLARSMGIRPSTARTHVDGILTKLGVHSRLEAVAYAVSERLVEPTADAGSSGGGVGGGCSSLAG
ncbi:MAG: response regulator transcription factor, partial [Acidimicrobiales bacterium]